jgi:hypothetical protein
MTSSQIISSIIISSKIISNIIISSIIVSSTISLRITRYIRITSSIETNKK